MSERKTWRRVQWAAGIAAGLGGAALIGHGTYRYHAVPERPAAAVQADTPHSEVQLNFSPVTEIESGIAIGGMGLLLVGAEVVDSRARRQEENEQLAPETVKVEA